VLGKTGLHLQGRVFTDRAMRPQDIPDGQRAYQGASARFMLASLMEPTPQHAERRFREGPLHSKH
jgi:hypothetical protein